MLGGVAGLFVWAAATGPKTYKEVAENDAARCIRNQGDGEWRRSSGISLETFCEGKAAIDALRRACKANPSDC
jgi:hypothetical protein